MPKISSFRSIENKNGIYRSNDYMKKFWESFRDHTMMMINLKKNKKQLINKRQQEPCDNAKI